jgi:hypothetical protein
MRAILAIAILAAMSLCGQLNKTDPEKPAANTAAPARSTPDKEAIKSELVKIEERITQAAVDGDITELVRNTTDDFKLTDIDGKVQNKNEALADVKKEKNIKNFSITDPELQSFTDDSAVLAYTLNVTGVNGRSVRARSTDSYVKKDGKWLLKSQQQTLIKK